MSIKKLLVKPLLKSSFAYKLSKYIYLHSSKAIPLIENSDLFIPFDYKKTFKQLENIDVVCIDLFDTLLFRKLSNPRCVFGVVSSKFNLQTFVEDRIKADEVANRTKGARANIDDIYEILSITYENTDELKDYEINLEKEITSINKSMLSFITNLKRENIKVVILSDMYLGKNIVRDILPKDVTDLVDDIIVSCDVGFRKSSGDIFDYVKMLYGKDLSYVLIDDNKINCNQALKHGFLSYLFPYFSVSNSYLSRPLSYNYQF